MKTSTSPAMRCFLFLFIVFFSLSTNATHICDFSFNYSTTGCSPIILSATAHETDSASVIERTWKLTKGATIVYASFSGTNAASFNYLISVSGSYCLSLFSRNTNGDTCSIQKCGIEVYESPNINFTFFPTSGCAPLNVSAICSSTAGSGVIDSMIIDWSCGPPTFLDTCPVGPIQHLYNCPPGCYKITVVVENSFGCYSDTSYLNEVCIIPKPHAYFSANVTSANCTSNPLNVNFTADSAGACMNYDWYINNVLAHTDTTRFFNHTFPINNNDCYDIMLVVRHCSGCSDTLLRTDYICVRQNPLISFATNFETTCLSQGGIVPLIITNTTSGLNQLTFQLTGPGGPYVIQTGSTATYNLSFLGTYTITAIGNFSAGCTDTLTKNIFVKPSPVANFTTPDTFSCKVPYLVHYTSLGCNTCTDTWQFPGGSLSTGSGHNVTTVYNWYTHYTATLIATDTNGCSATITKQLVNTVPLVAKMAFDHSKGCSPVCTVFDDVTDYTAVHSTPSSVCWSFDGLVNIPGACKDTIQRCFIDIGCYDVRLVVTTASGCVDSLYLNDTICVGEKPICTMTASPTSMCFEADSVCFHLTCANAFDRCHCKFGDGSEGDFYTSDFCHTFQDTGMIHPCCVAYKDSCPSDTFCFAITVYPPISKFLDSTFCAKGDTVFLYNKSINATSVLWTFCNGDTSTEQNPRVVLPECDTCSVTLQTHNSVTGCDHQKTRTINTACSGASFTTLDTAGCMPFTVRYTNTSFTTTPGFTRWDWDCTNGTSFSSGGDLVNHIFTAPGVYCIAMRNKSASGCIDTVYGTVHVCDLVPNYGPLEGCTSLPYCPVDSTVDSLCSVVSWYWDFGDGQTDTGQHPCHQYVYPGTYYVTLVVMNNLGCTRYITQAVYFALNANFTYTQSGDTIQFHNSSSGIYQTTEWSFGDGDTSSLSNPVHTYLTEDTFTVVLTVSDTIEGCYNEFSQTIIIAHPQSVTEITEAYSVRVIPNPFNDYTLLKIEGENTTGAEIRIADLLGNIVRSFKTDASGIAKIERENLASGMYIYEVRLKGKRIGNGKMIAQ